MVDLTPPSSSANTPKREMDVDEFSSASDPGQGDSDTELEEMETGQATPPLVEGEGEAGPSTEPAAGTSSKKSRRPPKDGLYESDIVQRWNKEIGDIFAQPSADSTSPAKSQPQSPSKV